MKTRLLIVASFALLGSSTAQADVKDGPTFLKTYCAKCHSGDKHMGNKEFDVLDAMSRLKTVPSNKMDRDYGKGKKYLVPKKLEESLIWLRVKDESMPKGSNKPTKEDKAILKKWIEAGAPDSDANTDR